jgi:hypothetical protein
LVKNQKLREHAAFNTKELEEEKRKNAELLKNADIERQVRVKHLADILRVSTESMWIKTSRMCHH